MKRILTYREFSNIRKCQEATIQNALEKHAGCSIAEIDVDKITISQFNDNLSIVYGEIPIGVVKTEFKDSKCFISLERFPITVEPIEG